MLWYLEISVMQVANITKRLLDSAHLLQAYLLVMIQLVNILPQVFYWSDASIDKFFSFHWSNTRHSSQ